MTPRDLRLFLILGGVVSRKLKQAGDAHRAELLADDAARDPDEAMAVGDRQAVHVRDGEGNRVLVGHVRVDPAPVKARVVDEEKFAEWVGQVAPDEVEVRVVVRPAFAERVLKQVRTEGKAVDPSTGELVDVPGVECEMGDPKVVAYPAKGAEGALGEAFRQGALPQWEGFVGEIGPREVV